MRDMKKQEKFFNSLAFVEKIGQGSYGRVYKVLNMNTNKYFAVKEVQLDSEESIELALNERGPQIRHVNILKYVPLLVGERSHKIIELNNTNSLSSQESSQIDSQLIYKKLQDSKINYFPRRSKNSKIYLYLSMPYCDFSLREFIDLRNTIFFQSTKIDRYTSEMKKIFENREHSIKYCYYYSTYVKDGITMINRKFIFSIFKGIINGLSHLHFLGIIHRDIKPSNILMVKNTIFVPKICDFGLMKSIYSSSTQTSSSQKKSDTEHDLFCAGLLYFELLWPFKTEMEKYYTIKKVKEHKRLPVEFATKYKIESKIIEACFNISNDKKYTSKSIQRVISQINEKFF